MSGRTRGKMRVIKYNGVLLNVQKVKIDKNGHIIIDGISVSPPMTIEAQAFTGFFALSGLKPLFEHMKCWKENSGEECESCPVKHNGTCGISGIKDAAIKEGIEKQMEGANEN
jgi:hypothetical protein